MSSILIGFKFDLISLNKGLNVFYVCDFNDLDHLHLHDLAHSFWVFDVKCIYMDRENINHSELHQNLAGPSEAPESFLTSYPVVVLSMFVLFYFLTRDIVHPFISNIIS